MSAACCKNARNSLFIRFYNKLEKKSRLIPSRKCQHLGFIFDTVKVEMTLPDDRVNKILTACKNILRKTFCSILTFAKVLGMLVAACPAVKYGWMHTKILERVKFLALLDSQGNYSKQMKIGNKVIDELNWWLNNLKISSFSISDIDYQLEIYSDASKVGWGGVCKGEKTNGFWDSTDSDKHINYLELLGAFNCLKFFTNHKNNLNVLLRIDNTISWKDLSFYAFPPFSLVVKVLKKVKNDQAKGILMVPNWQGQPWFPVFHQMLIAEPFFVGPNKELLLSSTRQLHPLWRKLILVAGLISGKHS